MAKWQVTAEVGISVHTTVEAETREEAIRIAMEERGMQSLCHQCASSRYREDEKEWRTSGELDGEPQNPTAEQV